MTMTDNEYSSAHTNMFLKVDKFTGNKYTKNTIPDNIVKTLDLIVDFVGSSQGFLFKDGKLMSLSIFNVFAWWKFLKLSYNLIKELIEIWK